MINTHSFERRWLLLRCTMTTKRATHCLAVILFVLSLFARSTECFRLRKTERRHRRLEASAGFQPGRILFGNVFEKRSSVDVPVREGAHGSPASAQDKANYQRDSPDLQTQVPAEMMPMDPSVLCGVDKMKFRLQGANVQQLAMDPGPAAPPVPLSYVPSACGFNVEGNPPLLVMTAPYNKCFMVQEGEYYVLPMRWQDTQFSLWCPMSQPTLPTPSSSLLPQSQPQYFLPPGFAPPAQQLQSPPDQQPRSPQIPSDQQPRSPQMPPDQQPRSPQMPPDQQPRSPQMPPDQQPRSPQMPPDQQPRSPQMPPDQQLRSPQMPPDQQLRSLQMLQLRQQMFPNFAPWNPYPVTAPLMAASPQMTSQIGSQQLFQPLFYPPLSFYSPSVPWGGLLYSPVAEPPVKPKAHPQLVQMPGFGYYPYNFPPVFDPIPQSRPKQPPLEVYPHFSPFSLLPIKMMSYPAA